MQYLRPVNSLNANLHRCPHWCGSPQSGLSAHLVSLTVPVIMQVPVSCGAPFSYSYSQAEAPAMLQVPETPRVQHDPNAPTASVLAKSTQSEVCLQGSACWNGCSCMYSSRSRASSSHACQCSKCLCAFAAYSWAEHARALTSAVHQSSTLVSWQLAAATALAAHRLRQVAQGHLTDPEHAAEKEL